MSATVRDVMTPIGLKDGSTVGTQRIYARVAGFLFLWLIITGLSGGLTISHLVGSGTFAETAKRVVASEHLYRLALASELIEAMSAAVLAFALYVTLKTIDKLIAQMAMYWRLGEAFIGGAGMIVGFVRLRLYNSSQSTGTAGTEQAQALMALTGDASFAAYNISAIFFSIGSILFCYLFFKSKYIPRILSAFGVFASVIVTIICFGSLIIPEHAAQLQYGWAPMAIAEVTMGFWLMFGVKIQGSSDPHSARSAVLRPSAMLEPAGR